MELKQHEKMFWIRVNKDEDGKSQDFITVYLLNIYINYTRQIHLFKYIHPLRKCEKKKVQRH